MFGCFKDSERTEGANWFNDDVFSRTYIHVLGTYGKYSDRYLHTVDFNRKLCSSGTLFNSFLIYKINTTVMTAEKLQKNYINLRIFDIVTDS